MNNTKKQNAKKVKWLSERIDSYFSRRLGFICSDDIFIEFAEFLLSEGIDIPFVNVLR